MMIMKTLSSWNVNWQGRRSKREIFINKIRALRSLNMYSQIRIWKDIKLANHEIINIRASDSL